MGYGMPSSGLSPKGWSGFPAADGLRPCVPVSMARGASPWAAAPAILCFAQSQAESPGEGPTKPLRSSKAANVRRGPPPLQQASTLITVNC